MLHLHFNYCLTLNDSLYFYPCADIQPNTTENSSLSLAVGSTHTLTCTVTGQPAPLVYWEWTPADKPTVSYT